MASYKPSEYYLGDPNLPTSNTKQEFTPEMVKEMKLAKNDIVHFTKYFYITTMEEGKRNIKLYPPQKRLIKSLVKNRMVITLASRQIGKTTCVTIYALWLTCFNKDKRVLIVANKEDTAIMILRRIRMAYEQLPNWLKPGVKQWGKTEVIFSNDSSIAISTTTGSAARGESINCVDGSSVITLKDKETSNVFDITMAELETILKETNGEMGFQLVDFDCLPKDIKTKQFWKGE